MLVADDAAAASEPPPSYGDLCVELAAVAEEEEIYDV